MRFRAASILTIVLSTASAQAQVVTVGTTLTPDVLRNLPTAGNLFSVLETMQAEAVTDRFNSGGLNSGHASHIVALLGSQRQTRYRVGEVDISSPTHGASLFFPELTFWQRVDVTTGLMPADLNANGLAMSLEPLRPSSRWTAMTEAFTATAGGASRANHSDPPPIARLDRWAHGSMLASGPVGRHAGIVVAADVMDGRTFFREQRDSRSEHARSLFTHVVVAAPNDREFRGVGWVQSVRDATTVHLQSTFEQFRGESIGWRIVGGYTQQARDEPPVPLTLYADRLADGPVPSLIRSGDTTERRLSLAVRLSPVQREHATIGLDYAGAGVRAAPIALTYVAEMIDGMRARLWSYTSPGIESQRRASTFSVFASDRFALTRRTTLEAGLRFESVRGSAQGAAASIDWYSWLPNVVLRSNTAARWASSIFAGYRRSANQLTLDLVEHGDPAAPVAQVFRWDPESQLLRSPIARVGPGTGGDPAFSMIEPHLRRPHTDELVIGLDSRLSNTWNLQLAGVARREAALINVVNIGVPASGYRVFTVPDANADLVGTADDQRLPVYERLPETFGQDRYLLTNPQQPAATIGALIVTARTETKRLFMLIGAVAAAVVGPGANRGFRANENDQDAIGEIFTNPNASTYARGRLFSDRAYTVKWTTAYRFPRDIRLGLIARYQDGQPFSRLVIVPGLAQGPEAIQAFANGRSRFAFTGTLDMRLQKGFSVKRARLDLVLDVYNLPNLRKEVEEHVVTGPRFRETTAVQPPRTAHVGVRVAF